MGSPWDDIFTRVDLKGVTLGQSYRVPRDARGTFVAWTQIAGKQNFYNADGRGRLIRFPQSVSMSQHNALMRFASRAARRAWREALADGSLDVTADLRQGQWIAVVAAAAFVFMPLVLAWVPGGSMPLYLAYPIFGLQVLPVFAMTHRLPRRVSASSTQVVITSRWGRTHRYAWDQIVKVNRDSVATFDDGRRFRLGVFTHAMTARRMELLGIDAQSDRWANVRRLAWQAAAVSLLVCTIVVVFNAFVPLPRPASTTIPLILLMIMFLYGLAAVNDFLIARSRRTKQRLAATIRTIGARKSG